MISGTGLRRLLLLRILGGSSFIYQSEKCLMSKSHNHTYMTVYQLTDYSALHKDLSASAKY